MDMDTTAMTMDDQIARREAGERLLGEHSLDYGVVTTSAIEACRDIICAAEGRGADGQQILETVGEMLGLTVITGSNANVLDNPERPE